MAGPRDEAACPGPSGARAIFPGLGLGIELGGNGIQCVLQGFFRQGVEAFRQDLGGIDGVLVLRQAVFVQVGHQHRGGAGHLQELLPLSHKKFNLFAQQANFLVIQGMHSHGVSLGPF